MTASADKVQFLLESSLQQTLPLVKKGVFTEQQLRQIMLEREKHENKLYSMTYKLSHFLKAIQFQYDLQRQRQYRIRNQEQENVNPLFKKQGKTDFSIVKRIIKLWDRTMHKYRYRTYLWKQYLSFCIAIQSKKHFYKALTNALRFLPFEIELWKIGVRYETQVGRNLWKARKLFHKGLKLVPSGNKNIQLTKQLIKFELQFVQNLQSRQKIIQGQDQVEGNDMKFIGGDQIQMKDQSESQNQNLLPGTNQVTDLLNLRQYHQVLYVALVDSINKNWKSKTYFASTQNISPQEKCQKLCDLYLKFLEEFNQNEENQLLNHILQVTIDKLNNYKDQLNGLKIEQKQEQGEQMDVEEAFKQRQEYRDNNLVEQQSVGSERHDYLVQQEREIESPQVNKNLSKQESYLNQILQKYQKTNKFDDKLFIKGIKELCLKPNQMSKMIQPLLSYFTIDILQVLRKNEWLRVPLKSLRSILKKLNEQFSSQKVSIYSSYLTKQIQKINPLEYMSQVQLLRQVIKLNKIQMNVQNNNKLYRSILVNCKQNIQFVQRAKLIFNE